MSAFQTVPEEGENGHSSPVAVFVHVHYVDVWHDMSCRLAEQFDTPFRLVVTSSLPDFSAVMPSTPFHRGTVLVRTANRGRDIRPFLLALHQAGHFEIGLKLHTKKSTHRLEGGTWREDILASLVSRRPAPSSMVRAFRARRQLGIIAPSGFLLPVREWILTNRRPMRKVARAAGHTLTPKDFSEGSFAAGSMFWFRREALMDFENPLLPELFESERGQTDGTAAHAIERLFGILAAKSGHALLPASAVPALLAASPERPLADFARIETTEISPFFRKPLLARLAARHVPLLFDAYGKLPIELRRAIRDAFSKR